jgi:hypothetical protein
MTREREFEQAEDAATREADRTDNKLQEKPAVEGSLQEMGKARIKEVKGEKPSLTEDQFLGILKEMQSEIARREEEKRLWNVDKMRQAIKDNPQVQAELANMNGQEDLATMRWKKRQNLINNVKHPIKWALKKLGLSSSEEKAKEPEPTRKKPVNI